MSEIKQLHKGDMSELLEFLNICFTGRADSKHFENGYADVERVRGWRVDFALLHFIGDKRRVG